MLFLPTSNVLKSPLVAWNSSSGLPSFMTTDTGGRLGSRLDDHACGSCQSPNQALNSGVVVCEANSPPPVAPFGFRGCLDSSHALAIRPSNDFLTGTGGCLASAASTRRRHFANTAAMGGLPAFSPGSSSKCGASLALEMHVRHPHAVSEMRHSWTASNSSWASALESRTGTCGLHFTALCGRNQSVLGRIWKRRSGTLGIERQGRPSSFAAKSNKSPQRAPAAPRTMSLRRYYRGAPRRRAARCHDRLHLWPYPKTRWPSCAPATVCQ